MGFPTKVQLINRKASEQWYINFPSAVAQAMEFNKGETVEWIIADKGHLVLSRQEVPPNPVDVEKKRHSKFESATRLFARSDSSGYLLNRLCPALRDHLLAVLLCPDRSTLSNLICTAGRSQADWTADYRLYSQERVDEKVLFEDVRLRLEETLAPEAPLVVAMDDTLVHKTGTHIEGVAWRRDPLGPKFQTNLVRGQRYVQFSAAWPLAQGQARMIPIGFFHAPSAPKPPKKAAAAVQELYQETKTNGTQSTSFGAHADSAPRVRGNAENHFYRGRQLYQHDYFKRVTRGVCLPWSHAQRYQTELFTIDDRGRDRQASELWTGSTHPRSLAPR